MKEQLVWWSLMSFWRWRVWQPGHSTSKSQDVYFGSRSSERAWGIRRRRSFPRSLHRGWSSGSLVPTTGCSSGGSMFSEMALHTSGTLIPLHRPCRLTANSCWRNTRRSCRSKQADHKSRLSRWSGRRSRTGDAPSRPWNCARGAWGCREGRWLSRDLGTRAPLLPAPLFCAFISYNL